MQKTTNGYHVRNCGRKDHTTILKIDEECFGYRHLNASDLDDLLKRCYCLVVVFDGLVVGYLMYEKNRNDKSTIICRWVVSPQYRNEGAGASLLNKLTDFPIRIKVRENAVTFQIFLKNRGFLCVPIGHRKIRQDNSVVQKPYYIEERGFENGDNAMLFELSYNP